MKYVLKLDTRAGHERVRMSNPSTGIKLDLDETRRVLINALEIVTDMRAAQRAANR